MAETIFAIVRWVLSVPLFLFFVVGVASNFAYQVEYDPETDRVHGPSPLPPIIISLFGIVALIVCPYVFSWWSWFLIVILDIGAFGLGCYLERQMIQRKRVEARNGTSSDES